MLKDVFLASYAAIPATVERAHIEQAVSAYLASYAANDISGRADLFADNAIAEEPVGSTPIHGKAALAEFWGQTQAAGWSVENELKRIVVNGNEACVVFESVMSVPDQGTVTLEVYETLVFNNQGKIERLRAYNDKSCLK